MKSNSLSKRCTAIILSLSLIVAQGCLSGLNHTAYAAADSTIENTQTTTSGTSDSTTGTKTTEDVGADGGSSSADSNIVSDGSNTSDVTDEDTDAGSTTTSGTAQADDANTTSGTAQADDANTTSGTAQADDANTTSGTTQADDANTTSGTTQTGDSVTSSDITNTFDSLTAIDNAGLNEQEAESFEKGSTFTLAAEDLPAEPETLLEEYYAAYGEPAIISLADDGDTSSQANNTPDIVINRRDVHYGDSFTIKYTTVNNKQKEFTFTSKMNPTIDILMTPYGNENWFGFKVLSIAVEVEDEEGTGLMFYADEILSSDFYITVGLELSNSDRLKGLEYTATPDDNNSWKPYTDAELTSGRYSIKVRKPYGAYLAQKDDGEKAETTGKALLIVLNGDLGTIPLQDAAALKATLTGTYQFKDEDIEILEVPSEDNTGEYKQKVWKWIDETAAAEDNEFSFIAYSGHGGYHDDGTAELSLGGNNTISGVELKQHVSKLHGKVMMLFDCCFSAAMIMPTMELAGEIGELGIDDMSIGGSTELEAGNYDGYESDGYSGEAYEQYLKEIEEQTQEYGEDVLKSFVSDFNKEKGVSATRSGESDGSNSGSEDETLGSGSTAPSSSPADLEYYIYTAASPYETGLQSYLGGQITTVFGYALGYARLDSNYNIFAADTDRDYKVSAKELATYISSSSLKSKPVTYYPTAKSSEALFTYDEASGVPAVLAMSVTTGSNIQMDSSTGSISVPVKVINYSDKALSFDAGAISEANTEENCPGEINYKDEDKQGKAFYTEDVNKHTIDVGKTWTGSLTFTDATKQYFGAGGRYIVKIWGTGDEEAEAFALTDFYIGDTETAEAVDDYGKKAFAIRQPAQVYAAADGKEVSAIVPINVVFDTEPTQKKGYAALTLTARAYDLGESYVGYTVDTDGYIALNETKFTVDDDKWIPIYTSIRPTYVRNNMYTSDTTGSTYSYAWDVSGLEDGHYYAVQVVCDYDGTTTPSSQKKTTFIKKTDKATADGSTAIIGESYIDINYFSQGGWNGIKTGETWKELGWTVKDVTETFTEYLNTVASYKYDSKNQDIHYSIADDNPDDKNKTGWWKYVNNYWKEMSEDEYFESGVSYMNRIILKIDSGYDAKFAHGAVFTVPGHTLVEEATSKISDDQKTATIYVLHNNMDISEDKIEVCRAGTSTKITAEDELKIGDKIDVYVPQGYSIWTSDKYSCLRKINTNVIDYTRFEVVQSEGTEIQFTVYKTGSGESTADCCCGTVFYTHKISNLGEAIKSISAPDKTFYDYYGDTKLDITGAKVTYYVLNEKGTAYETKTVALDTFMQDTGAKLYIKDGSKYLEWDDSYLKKLGSTFIYLYYNGEYISAFDVETGYEQGAKFSVSGDFTYNTNGSVSYISDDTVKKDAVLSLSVDSVLYSSNWGRMSIKHYAMIKSDNENASDYSTMYFTNGASIKYMVPYPEGLEIIEDTIFNINEEDRNVPVQIEARDDGLWITAYRNGTFIINIDVGGKGGPGELDGDGSTRNSSGRVANGGSGSGINSRVYGTWQTDTVRVGQAGASGVIDVNGNYIIPNTGVIEPDGSYNAAAAVGTETVKLYRFMMNNGEYATGWKLINYNGTDSWFLFGEDGYMRTGWAQDKDTWYYLNTDGTMARGWLQDNSGSWYLLGTEGRMATGWQLVGANWYYLGADGRMMTGQQIIDGKAMYFRPDGAWVQTAAS